MTAALSPRTAALSRGTTRRSLGLALDGVFATTLFLGTFLGVMALGLLLWTIYDRGWDRLAADPGAFLGQFVSRFPARAGVKAALYGTLWLMGLTALFSFPIGVGAAVYLEEFAPRNRLTNFIEANIANLAGVPSVVYGILGLGIFVCFLDMGPSLLAGGLTLAVMSLPVIVIAARESLRAVPESIRLAAYALGATKWQTVRHHVLPAALPGTMTGVILSLSRAIGETAPLLVVGAAVSIFNTPDSVGDRFSALPVLIFNWTGRPQPAFAAAAAAATSAAAAARASGAAEGAADAGGKPERCAHRGAEGDRARDASAVDRGHRRGARRGGRGHSRRHHRRGRRGAAVRSAAASASAGRAGARRRQHQGADEDQERGPGLPPDCPVGPRPGGGHHRGDDRARRAGEGREGSSVDSAAGSGGARRGEAVAVHPDAAQRRAGAGHHDGHGELHAAVAATF